MDLNLPLEIAPKRLPQLPASTSCISSVAVPVNGSTFSDNSQIILDLNTGRGFLNPNSVYIRYKLTATGAAAAGGTVAAPIPVYGPFYQLQVLFNSQVVENITDYNIVCQDLVNIKTNVAQKVGLSMAFGIGGNATAFSFNSVNGRTLLGAPDSFTMSAPLPCILSQAESYVPLFLFGSVRIILTLDTLANIFNAGVNVPTGYNISNFELCYDVINFDPQVEALYSSMANQNGKIIVKSSSWATGSQPLAIGSSGSMQIPYNFRLASVKSLLLHNSPAIATSATSNGKFDSVDVTSSNGSYQFEVASMLYPPRPLDTSQNKNGIISELCLALFGNRNIASADLGMTPGTWNVTSTSYGAGGSVTAFTPGMFHVGVNVERVPTSSSMLTGVTTLLSPINVRLNLNTATSQAQQIRLFAYYDALMEIDINTRDVKILQ